MIQFVALWATMPFLLESSRRTSYRRWAHGLLVVLAATVCALQPIESNADREAYQDIIRGIAEGDWFDDALIEPGFFLLVKLLSLVVNAELLQFVVYFVVAVISLSLKLHLFRKLGGALDFYALVFFSYFFLLQDATQIRAAIAVPLIFLAIAYFLERRPRAVIGCVAAATLFHFSGLLALPLIAAIDRRGGLRFVLTAAALALLGVVAVLDRSIYLSAFATLAGAAEIPKLQIYLDLLDLGIFEQINFLNRLAPHLIMLGSLLWLHRRWRHDAVMHVLLQVYVFGLLAFIALSPFPILAYRVSDILLFSGVLMAGRLSLHLTSRLFYRGFLVVYSATFLIYALNFSGIFIADGI